MIGRQERWQEDLFVAVPLRDLVPDDYILKRVDRVLDLSWLRHEVSGLYQEDRGRPGIDPETALQLLSGFSASGHPEALSPAVMENIKARIQ